MKKGLIFYINSFLFLVVVLIGVDTFSYRGHQLIQKALATVLAISCDTTIKPCTVSYLAKFVTAGNPSNTIGDSAIFDDGAGHIGIGTTTPFQALDVSGGGIVSRPSAWNQAPRGTASDREGLRITGTSSDYIISINDGNGRINHYWNAVANAGVVSYLVTGEPAGDIMFSPATPPFWFKLRYAAAGTAGSPITWTDLMTLDTSGNASFNGVVLTPLSANPSTPVNGMMWMCTNVDASGNCTP